MGTHSTVSMRAVKPLLEAAARAGAARVSLLRAGNITSSDLQALDARVPETSLHRILEAAVELTGDPAFGLHCINQLSPRSFNPVSDLVYHASDLRTSMSSLQQFLALLADDVCLELEEHERLVTVRLTSSTKAPLLARRFMAELVAVGLHRRVLIFRPNARFERVCFPHSSPSYHAEYARIFKAPIRFEQPFAGLVFERAAMDARSPFEDGDFHAALSAFGERKIRQLAQRSSYTARVHQAVLQHASPRHADMQEIARSLKVSERSLRRRLLAEGTTFASIVERALANAAKSCLLEQALSIQETAFALGFAEKGAFHRAFKRWTGSTPNAFLRIADATPTSRSPDCVSPVPAPQSRNRKAR